MQISKGIYTEALDYLQYGRSGAYRTTQELYAIAEAMRVIAESKPMKDHESNNRFSAILSMVTNSILSLRMQMDDVVCSLSKAERNIKDMGEENDEP